MPIIIIGKLETPMGIQLNRIDVFNLTLFFGMKFKIKQILKNLIFLMFSKANFINKK